VARILSTADIGLCPDPKNPLNDVSTMNKTMEYMAFALPVVAFDLRETRVSAGAAAVYAPPNEVADLARLVLELIDDEPRRRSMGALGRARVVDTLAWAHQQAEYVRVYDKLTHPEAPVAESLSGQVEGASRARYRRLLLADRRRGGTSRTGGEPAPGRDNRMSPRMTSAFRAWPGLVGGFMTGAS
jgi:hypothetical protein